MCSTAHRLIPHDSKGQGWVSFWCPAYQRFFDFSSLLLSVVQRRPWCFCNPALAGRWVSAVSSILWMGTEHSLDLWHFWRNKEQKLPCLVSGSVNELSSESLSLHAAHFVRLYCSFWWAPKTSYTILSDLLLTVWCCFSDIRTDFSQHWARPLFARPSQWLWYLSSIEQLSHVWFKFISIQLPDSPQKASMPTPLPAQKSNFPMVALWGCWSISPPFMPQESLVLMLLNF